jgi:hypothetical protein
VLHRKFFGFELPFGAAGADQDDVRSEGGCGLAFDGRSVVGHHDDSVHAEGTRGVGYALRVVAAGVGDYSAFAFFGRE